MTTTKIDPMDGRQRIISRIDQLDEERCPIELRRALEHAKDRHERMEAMNQHYIWIEETGKVARDYYEEAVIWPVDDFLFAFRKHGLIEAALEWLEPGALRRSCYNLREEQHTRFQTEEDIYVLDLSTMRFDARAPSPALPRPADRGLAPRPGARTASRSSQCTGPGKIRNRFHSLPPKPEPYTTQVRTSPTATTPAETPNSF